MNVPKSGTNVLILGTFVLISCSPAPVYQHWLSAEEDAALREKCEGKDCVMVPGVLWEQIKAALKAALGVEI